MMEKMGMGIGVKYEDIAFIVTHSIFCLMHRAASAFKLSISVYACIYTVYILFIYVHEQLTYKMHVWGDQF